MNFDIRDTATRLDINEILHVDRVKRWHICDTFRTQSVAGHSWTVTMLAIRFALDNDKTLANDPTRIRHIIACALVHDVPEIRIGDLPPIDDGMGRWAKQAADNFWRKKKVNTDEGVEAWKWTKLADLFEAWAFSIQCMPPQDDHTGAGVTQGLADKLTTHAQAIGVLDYTREIMMKVMRA